MSRKTKKLIWSVPVMAVLAIAGALAMFAALQPGNASADMLPAAPGELSVAAAEGDAGRTTLVLTWGAAADADGYRIDISDQGAVWETMMMNTGSTATTYTDDTLTASDTRWYRVFAVNSHGVGPVSNASSGTTDAKVNPGSVMMLKAVPNAKNPYNHIDLSWDAPAMNGGEKIVGYEVQYHNGSDWGNVRDATFTVDNVTITTKTSITDTSAGDAELDPGDKRLYRVRAINGPSEVSNTDTTTPLSTDAAKLSRSKEWVRVEGMTKAASNPGQVTGLTAVNIGAQQIDLYWYAPEDTGGWDISGYLIQARREGKKFPAIPADDELTTTASTAITLGDTTNPDNMNRFIGLPIAGVTQVTFTGIVGIDDPDDNPDAGAIQQRWYFRVFALTTDDGPNDATDTTDDVIRRSASPSNVASDVAAAREFDHDNGATDDSDTATPDLDPLAAPTITPTTGADAKKQQIDLALALAGPLNTHNALEGVTDVVQIAYRIDYSEDAGVTWKLLERDTRFTGFSATKPYADDKGLEFDETRHYRVFAIGNNPNTDFGPPSALSNGTTEASTAPKKPTGVMASSPSLRSIMASWTAPSNNGGQAIVKYHYQYAPDDGDGVAEAADFDATVNDNAEAADIVSGTTDDASTMGTLEIKSPTPALVGETVYAFRVAAVNKDGTADRPADTTAVAAADWSTPVLFSTSEAAKPNAVEGLTSELATDASGNNRGVNLLWNKPSGPAATGYEVEVQDEDGDWASPRGGGDVPAHQTSFTDSEEPEADEVRKYRVRASNGVGDGPWTMVYYPREPADGHPHDTTLTSASNVLANGTTTSGEIEVTWTAGANAVGHVIVVLDNNDDFAVETTVVPTADGQHTITGLPSGTYTVVVVAFKSATDYEYDTSGGAGDSVDTAVVN